ncbi:tRNA-dihydrouridine synthase [Carpediemonas membranifera]|uniref:tRNA-dihydrouridine synthase n=1 Tax=Carpediemonas membranifera TaxID=201153 RepID=A0A8J6ATX3_9EUKA|nr:tRNA-dihydrouridine synthase [Carpediemonas membranifera]|eukprot:KAG9391380.1 tRNA-dihydrouridine synthase [Carpediemonas membranifera]
MMALEGAPFEPKPAPDFSSGRYLAPMVRAGTLPMRITATQFGATACFTDVIIDQKLMRSDRHVSSIGSIPLVEYRLPDGGPLAFQTCPREGPVVCQIGSANDVYAISAVQNIERDVSAFDLNCGCNVSFSTKGDMGVNRMFDLESTSAVLKAMVRATNKPVTVKTRLYHENDPDNVGQRRDLEFLAMAEQAGVKAITIHARYPKDSRSAAVHWERLRLIRESANIPVIANGGLMTEDDIAACQDASGCTSFMLARGAFSGISMFKRGPVDGMEFLTKLYENSVLCGVSAANAKYNLSFGFKGRKELVPPPKREALQHCKSYEELGSVLGFRAPVEVLADVGL